MDSNEALAQATSMFVTAGNGLANQISVANSTHRDRAFMREMNLKNQQFAREQNQWNYDRWKEALQYDSPSEQYQRLLDAGLNPAYYMGNPATSGASQPSSADLANQQSEGQNLAQYASLRSQALISASEMALEQRKIGLESKRLGLEERKLYKNEELRNEELENLRRSGRLTEKQTEEANQRIDELRWKVEQARTMAERLNLENSPLRYQAKKYDDQIEKKWYEVENYLESLQKYSTGYESLAKGSLWSNLDNYLHQIEKSFDDLLDRFGVPKNWRPKMMDNNNPFRLESNKSYYNVH